MSHDKASAKPGVKMVCVHCAERFKVPAKFWNGLCPTCGELPWARDEVGTPLPPEVEVSLPCRCGVTFRIPEGWKGGCPTCGAAYVVSEFRVEGMTEEAPKLDMVLDVDSLPPRKSSSGPAKCLVLGCVRTDVHRFHVSKDYHLLNSQGHTAESFRVAMLTGDYFEVTMDPEKIAQHIHGLLNGEPLMLPKLVEEYHKSFGTCPRCKETRSILSEGTCWSCSRFAKTINSWDKASTRGLCPSCPHAIHSGYRCPGNGGRVNCGCLAGEPGSRIETDKTIPPVKRDDELHRKVEKDSAQRFLDGSYPNGPREVARLNAQREALGLPTSSSQELLDADTTAFWFCVRCRDLGRITEAAGPRQSLCEPCHTHVNNMPEHRQCLFPGCGAPPALEGPTS